MDALTELAKTDPIDVGRESSQNEPIRVVTFVDNLLECLTVILQHPVANEGVPDSSDTDDDEAVEEGESTDDGHKHKPEPAKNSFSLSRTH